MRFPSLEAVLGPAARIQECIVHLGSGSRYFIAFVYQEDQPVNRSLLDMTRLEWTGPMIVMKVGYTSLVVNMRWREDRAEVELAIRT